MRRAAWLIGIAILLAAAAFSAVVLRPPESLIAAPEHSSVPVATNKKPTSAVSYEDMKPLIAAMFTRHYDPENPELPQLKVCRGVNTLEELPSEQRNFFLEGIAFNTAFAFFLEADRELLDKHRNEENYPYGLLEDAEVAPRIREILYANLAQAGVTAGS